MSENSKEKLREQLQQIADEDFDQREEVRSKVMDAFRARVVLGKDLNRAEKRKLIDSLAEWGLTPDQFYDVMGVQFGNLYEAGLSFLMKAMKGELKAQREHMEKLKYERASKKRIAVKTLLSKYLKLKGDYNKNQIEPWLTDADKAHFLSTAGEPLVSEGVFFHSPSGKIMFSPMRSASSDQSISWKEGDEVKHIKLARVYRVGLDSGDVFILLGIPTEKGKESSTPSASLVDYLVTSTKNDMTKIIDEFSQLYFKHCLFKNKITKVDADSHGNLSFTIRGIPDKPALLDEQKQQRFDHIKKVVRNWDKLSKGERKMGLILYGLPGGGKTASITQLVKDVAGEATVFFVSNLPASFLAQIYPWLEKIGPNIIVCEDMDGIQVRRDGLGWDSESPRFISLLLDVLDGDKEYDVITVATTNYPERFDRAILRPGRLGMCIEFGPPEGQLKLDIVQFYLDRYNLTEQFDANDLVRTTFNPDIVLGSHIASTLKDVAVKVKLGEDPHKALDQVSQEYMGDESLGWQANSESSPNPRLGFGT